MSAGTDDILDGRSAAATAGASGKNHWVVWLRRLVVVVVVVATAATVAVLATGLVVSAKLRHAFGNDTRPADTAGFPGDPRARMPQ